MLQVQLYVDPNPSWVNTCYEIFTRAGVVRIARRGGVPGIPGTGPWVWTRPFETFDPLRPDEPPPFKDAKDTPNVLGIKIDGTSFRCGSLGLCDKGKDELVYFDKNGKVGTRAYGAKKKPASSMRGGDTTVFLPIALDPYQTGVAFSVRTYLWSETRPLDATTLDQRKYVWRWVSSAVIPWKTLVDCGDKDFALDTFQWSDARSDLPDVVHETFIVRKLSKPFNFMGPTNDHETHTLLKEIHELRFPDGNSTSQKEHDDATMRAVDESRLPRLMSHLVRVTESFVVSEYDYMMRLQTDPHDSHVGLALATTCAHGTLGIAIDGLPYDSKGSRRAGGLEWKFYGLSMQSWYLYDKPVVTSRWILDRLEEVQRLHCYEKSMEEDVENIVCGGSFSEKEHKRLRRRLTDVVRLCTIHSVSRPYIPDHTYNAKREWVPSDTYTPGLALPGDCEDGSQASYLIYMTLLFGNYYRDSDLTEKERGILMNLRKCAAICGVPLGVSGTSYNPMKNVDGEPHAFGVVVPFDQYIVAVFGKDVLHDALARFRSKYDFEYPTHFKQRPKVVETTVFCTTSYEEHDPEPAVVTCVVDEWLAEMGELHPAYSNVTKLLQNNESRSCHNYAIRAYGSYNREFCKDLLPKTWSDDTDASEYSCSFVFALENSKYVGITREQLFHDENHVDFVLRVPLSMSSEVWDSERELSLDLVRPIVPLISLGSDPYKKEEDRFELYRHDRLAPAGVRRVVIFVYDINYVYRMPKETTTISRLEDLRRRLSNALSSDEGVYEMKFEIQPYGFSHAIVFY